MRIAITDETQDLRREQRERAREERADAVRASDPDDRAAHERRAEKAAYLEQRLEEREAAEEEP